MSPKPKQKRSDGKRQTAPAVAADQLVRTVFQEVPGPRRLAAVAFETSPGRGVRARVDRTEVAVGDPALLRQLKLGPGSAVPPMHDLSGHAPGHGRALNADARMGAQAR